MEIVPIVLIIVTVILMVRNLQVYQYRSQVSEALFRKNWRGITTGKEKDAKRQQRWDELRSVSYDKMVLMFWRRPSSFYDPEFLKEIGVK